MVTTHPTCPHQWVNRSSMGDPWRECLLCGKQEDVESEQVYESADEIRDLIAYNKGVGRKPGDAAQEAEVRGLESALRIVEQEER